MIIICMCVFALVYPDASEEVSHILAKKLMGNGETRDSHDREQTESSSSSPSSWTRKESLNQLLKLQQMSKVPKLKGEVRIFSSAPKKYNAWIILISLLMYHVIWTHCSMHVLQYFIAGIISLREKKFTNISPPALIGKISILLYCSVCPLWHLPRNILQKGRSFTSELPSFRPQGSHETSQMSLCNSSMPIYRHIHACMPLC